MTKEEAEAKIQSVLVEMNRQLQEEVLPLAREHRVEFSFLGMTYHLFPMYDRDKMEVWNPQTEKYDYVPRPPADDGLLVADSEWHSSDFRCSQRFWKWHEKNWPVEDM